MSGELDFFTDFFSGRNRFDYGASRARVYNDVRREVRSSSARLNKRIKKQESYINSLSNNIKKMEREHVRNMNKIRSDFNSKLNKQAAQHSKDINNLRLDLQDEIQTLNHEFSEITNHIQSQVSALQNTEAKSADLAQQWADDAGKLLDFIAQNYRHEKFMPGQLNQLVQKMNTSVVANIRNGVFQAGLANAQSLFLDAQQLRTELELKEAEWDAIYNETEVNLSTILKSCEQNKNIEFEFNTDNGIMTSEVDVDFWSNGDVSKLIAELEITKNDLLDNNENYTIEELASLNETIYEREEHLKCMINKARNAVFASQIRQNLANELAVKFKMKGWELVDCIYEKDDLRNPLHVKFAMGDDEIVIKYSPESLDKSIRNSVNVAFFDRTRNDEEYRQKRLADIIDITQQAGLNTTEPVCKAGTEDMPCQDNSKLDFEKLKQKA